MALFNAAKEEYTTLGDSEEAKSKFHRKHAQEAYTFAVTHGGIYIKAAQFVSSLQGGAGEAGVPREWIDALRPLTDEVPPRPFDIVSPQAEQEFGKPIHDLVASVEEWPVAAASLAQVHRGYLSSEAGEDPVKVAIKLQYPSLQERNAIVTQRIVAWYP